MLSIHPYLNFPGTTEDAFNFYKSVFDGEFTMLQRYKDTPEAGNVPEEAREKIMHVSLPAGGQATMPMQKMFWGAYFGMCADKFGIQWMVSYQENSA